MITIYNVINKKVKDNEEYITSKFSRLTNVKTVAEL